MFSSVHLDLATVIRSVWKRASAKMIRTNFDGEDTKGTPDHLNHIIMKNSNCEAWALALIALVASAMPVHAQSTGGAARLGIQVSQAKVSDVRDAIGTRAILSQKPMLFEPNHQQAEGDAGFSAKGQGYGISLTPSEALLGLCASRNQRV